MIKSSENGWCDDSMTTKMYVAVPLNCTPKIIKVVILYQMYLHTNKTIIKKRM